MQDAPRAYLGLGRARSEATASDDQTFRLDGLAPGSYVVQARQKGVKQPFDGEGEPFIDEFSPCSAVVVTPGAASQVVIRWRE
jgi:hypothetical protein